MKPELNITLQLFTYGVKEVILNSCMQCVGAGGKIMVAFFKCTVILEPGTGAVASGRDEKDLHCNVDLKA